MNPPPAHRAIRAADWVAGLSIAGLLLPEAVAYSGIAGMPPQSGVIALFAGLLVYGLLGSSRFAIVSATSSSAAVLLAATTSAGTRSTALQLALSAGIVLLAGCFFLIAAAARLGAVSNLIAKPVLRGFALGLALTIVVKQLPKVVDVHPVHSDFFRLSWELLTSFAQWNYAGLAMAAIGVALLHGLGRWRAVPAALLVIAAGIALDVTGFCRQWHIAAVGPIELGLSPPSVPTLTREEWLRMGELAFAMALILYAESCGSIRTFALRHGDSVSPDRDLLALGAANVASGLFQGMPVGAGYSATSANEAAGAQSRAAGLIAGAVVLLAAITLLPWIAHTPEPLLAAIVIHAVGHTLNPGSLRPYFAWRRDRLIALVAFGAVLLFGVLDGLLAAIGVSLLLLLQGLSNARVGWLGRLAPGPRLRGHRAPPRSPGARRHADRTARGAAVLRQCRHRVRRDPDPRGSDASRSATWCSASKSRRISTAPASRRCAISPPPSASVAARAAARARQGHGPRSARTGAQPRSAAGRVRRMERGRCGRAGARRDVRSVAR